MIDKLTPQQFALEYLPPSWGERDLQLLVQRRIGRLVACREEVRIKTKATTRRSDLETWLTRYELKRELTYDSLKSALGQLYLYDHYGSKIFGCIPKRKAILGLSPFDSFQEESARRLADDIRGMGIEVIFLNECPRWREPRIRGWQIKLAVGITAAIAALFVGYAIASLGN